MEEIKGLTQKEIEERIKKNEINEKMKSNAQTYVDIIKNNLFTFFNLINIILFSLVLYTKEYKNGLFIFIILSNIIIGLFLEIKAKKTLEKLAILSKNTIEVIRDGKIQEIDIHKIVLDDIIILKTNEQIPCDSILIEGYLECNEALITGESNVIIKKPNDFLYSGSLVVGGKAYAKVTAVGENNYVNKILKEAKKKKQTESEIRDANNKILKIISYIIFPLGIVLCIKTLIFGHEDLNIAINSSVAAILGMIPEGLILLTSIALALGAIKLAKNQTLVQDLYAIEMLARVDVLCCDKTGTLTYGKMSVEKIINKNENLEKLEHYFNDITDENATAQALKDHLTLKKGWKIQKIIPFSSEKKYSMITYENETLIFGAPTNIFYTLDKEDKKIIDDYMQQGKRVLVFASTNEKINEENILQVDKKLEAIIVVSDLLKKETPHIMNYFQRQEVEVKIISGDDPITVSNIAKEANIKNIKAVDLLTKTDEEVEELAIDYNVFGRVKPEQKKIIIKALKRAGKTTAMTGDGINDVLALKEADCSIAMENGSSACKNVSSLVLLDSNFEHLPQIVDEGRRVINNLQRSSSLFLSKTIFSVLLSILTIIFIKTYPFIPIQLTLLSSLTIGIPAYFLALEPTYKKINKNYLQTILKNAFPGGISSIFIIVMIHIYAYFLKLDQITISTLSVVGVAGSMFITLYNIAKPLNIIRIIIILSMLFLFIIAVIFFKSFFSLINLNIIDLLFCMLLIVLAFFIQNIIKNKHN